MLNITYNNNNIQVENGKKVNELFYNDILKKNALACKFNNEVKSLNYELNSDGNLEFIDYSDLDGKRIYNRTILYIFSKALSELEPKANLTANYQIGPSLFCEIFGIEVTEDFLNRINFKMKEIIEKDIEIKKVVLTKNEAEEFYKNEKSLKGIVQLDANEVNGVSLYYCEDFYDYFYGVMPLSTGAVKVYELEKYENGFLITFPDKNDVNKISKREDNKKLFKTLEEYEEIYRILEINTIYNLNQKIINGCANQNVLLAEALHEKKIAEIANEIAKRKDVKMVLIAGPSSSGKTTFAKRLGLQLRLNGLKPVTISVDNYFVERKDTPKDDFGNYNFEVIEAIDLNLFNDHIDSLLNGRTVDMPTFDFEHGTKVYNGKKVKMNSDEILVIEGIHCLNDRLTSKIQNEKKFKVYISALTVLNVDYHNRISTTDTRLIRRIVRDSKFRHYSALHTLKMWYSVNRGEEQHIFPYQEQADVMFNSSLIYEMAALKEFAIEELKKIDNSYPEYSEAKRLIRLLNFFKSVDINAIPNTSLLREFIGESIFEEGN